MQKKFFVFYTQNIKPDVDYGKQDSDAISVMLLNNIFV